MGFYEDEIFSRFADFAMQPFGHLRERALEKARGRVLEIGHGSGLNLEHLPEAVTELIGVDPSGGMLRKSLPRQAKVKFPVTILKEGAEKISEPDASFDTVITTLTFCTIPDPVAAAKEARRLIKPGGSFLFLEHVRHPDPGVEKWQNRLNPVWKKVFCGCNLNRDTWTIFEEAGFDLSGCRRIQVEGPRIVEELIVGEARPV